MAVRRGEARAAAPRVTEDFQVYIGASIRGLIQNGDIFPGDRAAALRQAEAAINRYPDIRHLICDSRELAAARIKIKTPGNALYAINRALILEITAKNEGVI